MGLRRTCRRTIIWHQKLRVLVFLYLKNWKTERNRVFSRFHSLPVIMKFWKFHNKKSEFFSRSESVNRISWSRLEVLQKINCYKDIQYNSYIPFPLFVTKKGRVSAQTMTRSFRLKALLIHKHKFCSIKWNCIETCKAICKRWTTFWEDDRRKINYVLLNHDQTHKLN